MRADPHAFRVKFRKMAADPFAFYRGSALPVLRRRHRAPATTWADERTSRVWIHGDLHAENFGTYLNSRRPAGLRRQRLRRGLHRALLLGPAAVRGQPGADGLAEGAARADGAQPRRRATCGPTSARSPTTPSTAEDDDFALHLDNTDGPVLEVLAAARSASRVALLDGMTRFEKRVRVFDDHPSVRRLGVRERGRVEQAFAEYLETIPESKRFDRALFYEVRDIVGKSGFGIGSAGLPAYNVLVEGYSQSLDNDVVLSMKQANVPAVSRFVDTTSVDGYFEHEGHRTVVSQRALQVHTDPLLGYTSLDGVGYVVAEVSPYEFDLDWGEINEPDEMASVVTDLGRATAKVHCASDEDSDQDLVTFQTEEAICGGGRGTPPRARRRPDRLRHRLRAAGASRPRAVRRRVPRGPHRRGQRDLTPPQRSPGGRRRSGSAVRNPGVPAALVVRRLDRPADLLDAVAAAPGRSPTRRSRPPVIRAPSAPCASGGVHGDVELVAGDLVVVAQRLVRGGERRAHRGEVAGLQQPDRLADPVDLGEHVPHPRPHPLVVERGERGVLVLDVAQQVDAEQAGGRLAVACDAPRSRRRSASATPGCRSTSSVKPGRGRVPGHLSPRPVPAVEQQRRLGPGRTATTAWSMPPGRGAGHLLLGTHAGPHEGRPQVVVEVGADQRRPRRGRRRTRWPPSSTGRHRAAPGCPRPRPCPAAPSRPPATPTAPRRRTPPSR